MVHGHGPDNGASRACIENFFDFGQCPQSASELDGDLERAENRLRDAEVSRFPPEGSVEIHQMKPRRAQLLPMESHGHGIIAVFRRP